MSSPNQYQRFPTRRVLIEDMKKGAWNEDERVLQTRYGKLKRVRICGTIVIKKDIVEDTPSDSFLAEDANSNSRVSLLVDDGTGAIWATLWGVDPEDFKDLLQGSRCFLKEAG